MPVPVGWWFNLNEVPSIILIPNLDYIWLALSSFSTLLLPECLFQLTFHSRYFIPLRSRKDTSYYENSAEFPVSLTHALSCSLLLLQTCVPPCLFLSLTSQVFLLTAHVLSYCFSVTSYLRLLNRYFPHHLLGRKCRTTRGKVDYFHHCYSIQIKSINIYWVSTMGQASS